MAEQYARFPEFAEWSAREIDLALWNEGREALVEARSKIGAQQLQKAVEQVTRAAAVDTGAIEGLYEVDRGFTLSVAAQTATWEVAFEDRGPNARRLFDAQLKAFELVLDAATASVPVVGALIRALHQLVCGAQDTYMVITAIGPQEQELPRGEYKRHPNSPRRSDGTEHAYCPVELVQDEMQRLTKELESDLFTQGHPAVQAAYAHYALTAVHPFPDGNGRVARALASVYLVRATSLPLLVFADLKARYLDTLARADDGEHLPFTEFIRDRSLDSMNWVRSTLKRSRFASPEEIRSRAKTLYYAAPELTHSELDAAAERLLAEFMGMFSRAFTDLGLPQEIVLTTARREETQSAPPAGYRRFGTQAHPRLEVVVKSMPPAHAEVSAIFHPLIARRLGHPMPIRISREGRPDEVFDARIEDVFPSISASIHFQLGLWVETVLAELVEEAIQRGQKSLEVGGWGGR